jgi:anti-sigma factor RsiW
MTHDETEALLGAYALDAASEEEREQVERHLASCPRCQAELAAHREMAAMMAAGLGSEVPARVWEKVAASTFLGLAHREPAVQPPLLGPLTEPQAGTARRGLAEVAKRLRAVALGLGTAAAAATIALASLFGVEVGQLHTQVHRLEQQVSSASLAAAAAMAAAGPHVTVTLTASDGTRAATVVVTPKGDAYWISSRLAGLPASQTYQLWGLVRGRPVSLGLLGPEPSQTSPFRLEAGTAKLMVTAEPTGGVPLPTTAVLAVGSVPPTAVS